MLNKIKIYICVYQSNILNEFQDVILSTETNL